MTYGYVKGQRGYRAFDIAINNLPFGKALYIDFDMKVELFKQFGIEMVPVLYRGLFSPEILEEYTSGSTTLCPPENLTFKGREGIVVTPVKEQFSEVLLGRLILKSLSADYLARKGGTDYQ
jgi:hypothetical protein